MQRRQLNRYESGTLPTDEILRKLALFYEVSFQELKELYYEDFFAGILSDSEAKRIFLSWVKKYL